MPRFGISIYCISRKLVSKEWEIEKAINWIAEAQAEVLEIVPFGIDMVEHPELLKRAKNSAEENFLPIGNYSLNANFLQLKSGGVPYYASDAYQSEMERVRKHIAVAGELGADNIRIDCSSFRRDLGTVGISEFIDEHKIITDTYGALCEYAREYKLSVLLENHGFHVNGAERILSIYNAIDDPAFHLQIDCGNFLCVDEIPEVAVKKTIGYAKTVHMKDFYIRKPGSDPGDAKQFDCENSWFRSVYGNYLRGSILGQGDTDIKAIMHLMKQARFQGDMYLEYEGMEECLYATTVSFNNMKRLWLEA